MNPKQYDAQSSSREVMLNNEMRSMRNHGFHDGYDEGRQSVIQEAFDTGYKRAYEQSFIQGMLKGAAHALRSYCTLDTPDQPRRE